MPTNQPDAGPLFNRIALAERICVEYGDYMLHMTAHGYGCDYSGPPRPYMANRNCYLYAIHRLTGRSIALGSRHVRVTERRIRRQMERALRGVQP